MSIPPKPRPSLPARSPAWRGLASLGLLGLAGVALAAGWSEFEAAFPGLPCQDGWAGCVVDGKPMSPGMVLDAGGRPHKSSMRVGFFDLDPLPAFSPFTPLSAYTGGEVAAAGGGSDGDAVADAQAEVEAQVEREVEAAAAVEVAAAREASAAAAEAAQAEAAARAEEQARRQAEEQARRQAEEADRQRQAAEAAAAAAADASARAEAQRQAEEARRAAEAARKAAEEEARRAAEAEAARKAAEAEAKRKAEEESRRQAEAEAARKAAEEEARRKAETAAAEAAARKQAEEAASAAAAAAAAAEAAAQASRQPDPAQDAVAAAMPTPTTPTTAPAAPASCDNLVALEVPAMMGQLGAGVRSCLDGRLGAESTQTTKDKISRVLIADAEARRDQAEWESLMKNHLENIDRSDPNLCFKYALHLSRGSAARAPGVIRWAEYALENKQQWEGANYTKNVNALLKIRAQAANKLWQAAEQALVDARNDENESKAERYRGQTKDFAREWLDYARASGQETTAAMALCVSAAGNREFCGG